MFVSTAGRKEGQGTGSCCSLFVQSLRSPTHPDSAVLPARGGVYAAVRCWSRVQRCSRTSSGCRCKTCGEYIYKGKKFNARKETVQNEAYLGLPIFRFYIKCTRCLAEITFKVGAPFTHSPFSLRTPHIGADGRCLQRDHTQRSLPSCMCADVGSGAQVITVEHTAALLLFSLL